MRGVVLNEKVNPLAGAARAMKEAQSTPTSRAAAARYAWERLHTVEAPGLNDIRTAAERARLAEWYTTELRPRLAGVPVPDAANALGISPAYARSILRYGRMPHPRHFAALARLVGIEPPKELAEPKA
jgi:hypothetical protein